jgi:hypothetical protein
MIAFIFLQRKKSNARPRSALELRRQMCVYPTARILSRLLQCEIMSELNRILVIDDGVRASESALSAELAELGYASVTTSLEAADEVMAMLPPPVAILLQLPRAAARELRSSFSEAAARLQRAHPGIPVILLDPSRDGPISGYAALLQAQVGSPAYARPDHS